MLCWECGATDRVDRERLHGNQHTPPWFGAYRRACARAPVTPDPPPCFLRTEYNDGRVRTRYQVIYIYICTWIIYVYNKLKCCFDFIMILMIIPQSCNYPCSNLSFRTFGDDSDCCDWVFVASRDCGGCGCCHCCYYYYYGQPRVDH